MSTTQQLGRTYNQNHVPRPYTPGKRRFSIYWTWSYPWETNRDLTELDNRFSTMSEVRRVAWPSFEGAEWDKMNFLQGSPARWSYSTVPPSLFSGLWAKRPGIQWPFTNASTRQGISC